MLIAIRLLKSGQAYLADTFNFSVHGCQGGNDRLPNIMLYQGGNQHAEIWVVTDDAMIGLSGIFAVFVDFFLVQNQIVSVTGDDPFLIDFNVKTHILSPQGESVR